MLMRSNSANTLSIWNIDRRAGIFGNRGSSPIIRVPAVSERRENVVLRQILG